MRSRRSTRSRLSSATRPIAPARDRLGGDRACHLELEPTQELIERRVYGMGQVDRLLGLSGGRRGVGSTSTRVPASATTRWSESSRRASTSSRGASSSRCVCCRSTGTQACPSCGSGRPSTRCASSSASGIPWHANVNFEARSVVAQIQTEVGLERALQLVELQRNTGQLQLDLRAQHFVDAIEFESGGDRRVLRPRPPLGGRTSRSIRCVSSVSPPCGACRPR